MIDVEAEREQTPGCRDQSYLDSAGSSLPTRRVTETMVAHLRREAEIGGYRAAAERREDLDGLCGSLGRLLGCAPDLIALTDSATRSWNQLVTSIRWRSGDRILICANEYASNAIALLQRARLDGCAVEVVPNDAAGRLDLERLEVMLDERVRLVSLVHVPTNSGQISPVEPVVALAHAVGALVVLDACQSVGQLALDADELGVDALTASGRKWLRGPRGTGFLYLRRELLERLEPAAADMRGGTWTAPHSYELRPDAARFELSESSIAGRLGLKEAVDHLLGLGPDVVEHAVRGGAERLRHGLGAITGVTVHDNGEDLSGLVSFTVTGREAYQVQSDLERAHVTVAVSEAASTLLDMRQRALPAVVRASPHYFVSAGDLDRTLDEVASIAAATR